MKSGKCFSVIIVALFITFSGYGQETKKVIKINPISPFLRTINLAYQKSRTPKTATQLRAFYTYWSPSFTFSGYGIMPEYMFYFGSTAPKGFYLSIFGRYEAYKFQYGSETQFTTTVSGGLVAGHQFIFHDLITLELFAGHYYSYSFQEVFHPSFPDQYGNTSGLGIRAGLTFGFVLNSNKEEREFQRR